MFESEGLNSISYTGTSYGVSRTDYTVMTNSFQSNLSSNLSSNFIGGSRIVRYSSHARTEAGFNNHTEHSSISYSGGNIITTRISSKTINSYGAGNVNTQALGGSFVTIHRNISSKTINSYGAGNVNTQTLGGSFITIHRNNSTQNSDGSGAQPLRRVIQFPGEDYETPPTGELDDSFASPVGDVLLPLLLMAAAYAVVRWFKNWKRKHTGKRLFYIK